MGRKAVSYLLHYLGVVVTLLLLASAVLSWRASYFSPLTPEWGNFWMTIALLMPVILVLNLAVFIWWLIRGRWGLVLIPLAALILNLNYISAMIQLPDFNGGRVAHDIRVMSLNTNGFRRTGNVATSAWGIAGLAMREKVDIVCLQEFSAGPEFPTDSIDALFTGRLPYFVREKGQALFSRYPILDHRYVIFPETNNDYLWVDLKIDDRTVRVFSVHLQTSGISSLRHRFRKNHNSDAPVDQVLGSLEDNSRIRVRQVDEIRAVIDSTQGPVIVAGDFNDTPSSYVYRRMKADMTDGFRANGSGFGSTFRSLGGMLRIDYIFYNDSFTGVRYFMPDEDVSDHKAVIADIRFKR